MTLLALNPGTRFAGRYQIVRCIAQGGMGAVYEVLHLGTDRRRALKVMLPDMLQSQEMRDRFRQEARVTANIESEFLVDVFDAGIDDETQMPFLVMEMLRGEELHKRLKRVKRLSLEEAVTLLHQLGIALDKTHKASIIHRDLKPGNLFLTERDDGSPRIKVLDFGIAKLILEGSTNAEATRNLGTPTYMAPEQFQIGRKLSPASDVYALGMITYTMLVGVPYWHDEVAGGANVFAFAATAMLGPQESACARALRRGVSLPSTFDAWFTKVTAIEPADRFQTASSAVYALAEAVGVPLGQPRVSQASIASPEPPSLLDAVSAPLPPPAPTTGIGVSRGAPTRPPLPSPIVMIGGALGTLLVITTVTFMALRKGEPEVASPAAQPSPVAAELSAAPPSPSIEADAPIVTVAPSAAAPASAAVPVTAPTAKPGAGSPSKAKPRPTGTTPKRRPIYTPD